MILVRSLRLEVGEELSALKGKVNDGSLVQFRIPVPERPDKSDIKKALRVSIDFT